MALMQPKTSPLTLYIWSSIASPDLESILSHSKTRRTVDQAQPHKAPHRRSRLCGACAGAKHLVDELASPCLWRCRRRLLAAAVAAACPRRYKRTAQQKHKIQLEEGLHSFPIGNRSVLRGESTTKIGSRQQDWAA